MDEKPKRKRKALNKNSMVGVGIAIGIAIGAAIDNIGLGIALGVALGVACSKKACSEFEAQS